MNGRSLSGAFLSLVVICSGALAACTGSAPQVVPQPKAQLVKMAPGHEQVNWLGNSAPTAPVKVFFAYDPNVEQRRRPFTRPVTREVHAEDAGATALQLLFEGPRPDEADKGLRFEASGATGISELRLNGETAHVRLSGGCDARGSVVTVADEITTTLKQFPVVEHVKVYGPDGTTQDPTGANDSIPACLAATLSPTVGPPRPSR